MKETYGYFPIFINIQNQKVCIYGGGNIALRRVKTLLDFGAKITVVAPDCTAEIRDFAAEGKVQYIADSWESGSIPDDAFMVIAATSSEAVNHEIYMEAKQKNITANNASNKEECDFYFPAIIRQGAMVAGLTASGTDHKLTRRVAARLRNALKQIMEEESHE
jgi:precorrin-2 dehydrogenase/sirohydrochlorin ferrochelatase